MKTEKEWNNDIANITIGLDRKFCELLKYIEEMPANLKDTTSPEMMTSGWDRAATSPDFSPKIS